MSREFALIDLVSQAGAVQRHWRGWQVDEKFAWLDARGTLTRIETPVPNARTSYRFESRVGRDCVFFLDGDKIVFVGDHTTYTVDD
jgi:hypothetical protein